MYRIRLNDGLAYPVLALYGAGWIILSHASGLLGAGELLGLAQVTRYFHQRSAKPVRFKTPGLYRFVRHPIYLGWLIVFWAAPRMTGSHLLFAMGLTVYILLAIKWEEKDLISELGEDYIQYRERVPALFPRYMRK